MTNAETEKKRKQLLYRAQHRGFKEADLVIGGFAATHLQEMDEAELDAFAVLIDYPDHDLYDWIVGAKPAPAEFLEATMGTVFAKLQNFDVAAITAP